MKQIVYLSLTPERWAVARGTATPEQRKIAKKQRCFIALEEPYYPTVGDMKEAINWLADRGFGKAPQTVPIESDQPTGYPVELRQWPPGIDPVAQGDGGIDRKAKDVPGGSSNDSASYDAPGYHPTCETSADGRSQRLSPAWSPRQRRPRRGPVV